MKKVYLFYANDADAYPGRERGTTAHLYAFTTSKETAKMFRSIRNMKIFKERKEEMSKQDYKEFARDNRECLIELKELRTLRDYPENHGDNFESITNVVKMPMTFMESMSIDEVNEHLSPTSNIFSSDASEWLPIIVFKKEIRKALTVLQYPQILQIFYMGVSYDDLYYGDSEPDYTHSYGFDKSLEDSGTEYSMPNVWFDELALFIHFFGHTLKIKNY